MHLTTNPTHSTDTVTAVIEALRTRLRGQVIDAAHAEYDAVRRVWNGLIDRQPGVIARCADTADVVEAVRVTAEHRPTVSIRGGGHQVAGSAVNDGGVVIDLSVMTAVDVDPETRTVRAQAGATWADVDRATQLFGLAVPGGEVSETGIAGLTLGGGLGLLMRARGLTCDNLRSIEIVTADGVVRRASADAHADLFWAARGGGRGIGVVTSFEFDAHPLGPDVAMAQLFYPYDDAKQVLRAWRDLAPQMPETVSPEFALWSLPPDPALPAHVHGAKVVVVAGLYAGSPDEAGPVLAPLAQLGTPLTDLTATMPYVDVQQARDAAFPAGARYYATSLFADQLTDDAVDALLDADSRRPTPQSLIVIRTLGGAVDRVPAGDSAYGHRGAQFNISIEAGWIDAAPTTPTASSPTARARDEPGPRDCHGGHHGAGAGRGPCDGSGVSCSTAAVGSWTPTSPTSSPRWTTRSCSTGSRTGWPTARC